METQKDMRQKKGIKCFSVHFCALVDGSAKSHELFTPKNGSNRSIQLVRWVCGAKNTGLHVSSKITAPPFLEKEVAWVTVNLCEILAGNEFSWRTGWNYSQRTFFFLSLTTKRND